MKKIIISIALVSTTIAFAQKKEILAAYKSIEANDFTGANSQISAADAVLGDKTYLLEPALLEQYYYAKGVGLLKSGKYSEGAAYLAKINDLGKSKIYTGKDAEKNRVYFLGKEAAEKSGIQNLKEETYEVTTAGKMGAIINPILQSVNKEAVDAYNGKNFVIAGDKFKLVYNLLKAAGSTNGQLLYNSAVSYALGKDNDKSIQNFDELLKSGYTGVETKYTAKNKKSGQVEDLDKASWDLLKKTGTSSDYTDFKTETSKNVEQDIYETYVGILFDAGKYDQVISIADAGLKKFPTSKKMTELQGSAYYKSGKTNDFTNNLKAQLAKNPNDKTNWYNLGVILSKDPANQADAENAFKKAVELDPKFANAWQNLTFLAMGDDEKAINEYNSLKKAGKPDAANKVLDARRARFAKALPYAEKWYEADTNNIDAVSLLKSFYSSAKNETKAAEFRAKEAAMKGK